MTLPLPMFAVTWTFNYYFILQIIKSAVTRTCNFLTTCTFPLRFFFLFLSGFFFIHWPSPLRPCHFFTLSSDLIVKLRAATFLLCKPRRGVHVSRAWPTVAHFIVSANALLYRSNNKPAARHSGNPYRNDITWWNVRRWWS